MGKYRKANRRKSSGSDSDDSWFVKKAAKRGGPASRREDELNVSDLISQSNSVLYESDPDCCDYSNAPTDTNIRSEAPRVDPDTMSQNKQAAPMGGPHGGTPGATGTQQTGVPDFASQMNTLLTAVDNIQRNQESMKRMFESKLDRLRTDLMENIDNKVKELRDEFSLDLSREGNRISEMATTIADLSSRLGSLENNGGVSAAGDLDSGDQSTGTRHSEPLGHSRRNRVNPLNDPDITIIASGIPVTEGEDLMQKAEALVAALGDAVAVNVLVTGAERLPTRYQNRPPLVKISFQNIDEKILVLRNKMTLKDVELYKDVYLKSSKSHIERLIELNARAILNELPTGRNFRVDANGRIKQRTRRVEQEG